MNNRAAIVLSGCGRFDGSEVHESTLLLLACAENNITVDAFAPVMNQSQVINHINQTKEPEARIVITESARISRGEISPLEDFQPDNYDFLIFPGGLGVLTNLSNYGLVNNPSFEVHAEVARAINAAYEQCKPIIFACASPIIAAKVLGHTGLKLTLGNNPQQLSILTNLGAEAVSTNTGQVLWDETHRVGSFPAYMLAKSIKDVYQEATQIVATVVNYVHKKR